MADLNYTKYSVMQAYFDDMLQYNPDTGIVTWKKVAKCSRLKVGNEVGCLTKDGYRQACIKNKSFYLHIVAWYLHYGSLPTGILDHRNGNRSDNRIANLRVVSKSENIQNQRKPNKRNKTGFLGVTQKWTNSFVANLKAAGKTIRMGPFKTAEEAYEAYVLAKRKHHPGCTL